MSQKNHDGYATVHALRSFRTLPIVAMLTISIAPAGLADTTGGEVSVPQEAADLVPHLGDALKFVRSRSVGCVITLLHNVRCQDLDGEYGSPFDRTRFDAENISVYGRGICIVTRAGDLACGDRESSWGGEVHWTSCPLDGYCGWTDHDVAQHDSSLVFRNSCVLTRSGNAWCMMWGGDGYVTFQYTSGDAVRLEVGREKACVLTHGQVLKCRPPVATDWSTAASHVQAFTVGDGWYDPYPMCWVEPWTDYYSWLYGITELFESVVFCDGEGWPVITRGQRIVAIDMDQRGMCILLDTGDFECFEWYPTFGHAYYADVNATAIQAIGATYACWLDARHVVTCGWANTELRNEIGHFVRSEIEEATP